MKRKVQLFNIKGVKCNNCVNDILEDLNKIKIISHSKINNNLNEVEIISDKKISTTELQSYIKRKYIVEKKENYNTEIKETSKIKQLYPLFLIIIYIFSSCILLNINKMNIQSFMLDFMGIFFVVFSFFKLLNLKGFQNSFKKYDLIGKQFNLYCWIYPFIEIVIGIFLLMRFNIYICLIITLIILISTSIGVAISLRKNENTKCACLGSVLNLPMTEATLIENFTMIIMTMILLFSIQSL